MDFHVWLLEDIWYVFFQGKKTPKIVSLTILIGIAEKKQLHKGTEKLDDGKVWRKHHGSTILETPFHLFGSCFSSVCSFWEITNGGIYLYSHSVNSTSLTHFENSQLGVQLIPGIQKAISMWFWRYPKWDWVYNNPVRNERLWVGSKWILWSSSRNGIFGQLGNSLLWISLSPVKKKKKYRMVPNASLWISCRLVASQRRLSGFLSLWPPANHGDSPIFNRFQSMPISASNSLQPSLFIRARTACRDSAEKLSGRLDGSRVSRWSFSQKSPCWL